VRILKNKPEATDEEKANREARDRAHLIRLREFYLKAKNAIDKELAFLRFYNECLRQLTLANTLAELDFLKVCCPEDCDLENAIDKKIADFTRDPNEDKPDYDIEIEAANYQTAKERCINEINSTDDFYKKGQLLEQFAELYIVPFNLDILMNYRIVDFKDIVTMCIESAKYSNKIRIFIREIGMIAYRLGERGLRLTLSNTAKDMESAERRLIPTLSMDELLPFIEKDFYWRGHGTSLVALTRLRLLGKEAAEELNTEEELRKLQNKYDFSRGSIAYRFIESKIADIRAKNNP